MSIGFSPKQRAANKHSQTVYYPGSLAADVSETWTVFRAPANGTVSVSYVPQSAVTGVITNSANLNTINKGTAGAGVTEIGNVDFGAGTNAAAFAETALCTDVSVTDGSVVTVQREKVGTGLALPEGAFVIEFAADDWA